jgi:N-acetylglutamate synthase-like GNAT family acetyltransferase
MREHWGSEEMIDRSRVFYPAEQAAFIAEQNGEPAGAITYNILNGECEVTSLVSLHEGQGVGTALMKQVIAEAQASHCRRLWLLTTNDSLNARQFYQKLGLRLVALYPNAVDEARKLKPEIPEIGQNGIPLRDEFELEMILSNR